MSSTALDNMFSPVVIKTSVMTLDTKDRHEGKGVGPRTGVKERAWGPQNRRKGKGVGPQNRCEGKGVGPSEQA